MMLATTDETKHALRIDDADLLSDTDIDRLIMAASEGIIAYLKSDLIMDESVSPPVVIFDPNASPPVIPERVKQATIMLVGYFYRSPDADREKDWELGYLPKPVMNVVYQLRDPALV